MEDKMKYMKYIIPIIMLSLVLLSCAKKDEKTTTDVYTCTGTSSGSGPTIGSVTLEEAAYLSSCFGGTKIKLEFKNNSSAQKIHYASYSGDSCAGTASTEITSCIESITVSSTTVTKQTYIDGSLGSNVTGYDTTGILKSNSTTKYMNFSADNASVFYYNQASTQSKLDSNAWFFWKFTKQ